MTGDLRPGPAEISGIRLAQRRLDRQRLRLTPIKSLNPSRKAPGGGTKSSGVTPAHACLVPNIFHWSKDFSSRRPSMLWWLASLGAPHETRTFCSTCLLHRLQIPSCLICRFQDCHSATRFFDSEPPSKTNPQGS